jgi:iron-sulfur cluster repair protein YtfE (RIC family)
VVLVLERVHALHNKTLQELQGLAMQVEHPHHTTTTITLAQGM